MEQQEKPPKFLYLPEVKNDHFIIGGADDRPDASVPGSEPGRDLRSPRVSTPARAAGI